VELLLDLKPEAGVPLRRRLEREIRDAVRAGRLAPGMCMPSTRALSAQLAISRGVVVEAYAQLVAEGWLSARQGAATVVAARAAAGGEVSRRRAAPRAQAPVHYDFRYGTPDLSAFPRAAWLTSGARTLRALPDARLGYGHGRGALELREALAFYLGRVRGVVADPELMLVSGGTRDALGLVWRVLREAGARRVAIEDPGWSAQRETALQAGLEPVPVAVDERGMRVGELEDLDVDAVALTPAHQCPTGAVLAPERRAALLDWARRRDAWVVEDDYDAEYRYDREPVGAVQGMAPERVVYAGSASKTLAPALRIGWLVLPERLVAPAARRRLQDDRGRPLLDQLTLADLVAGGELDRHLRRTRRRYRARRDALVGAVEAELAGGAVEGIAAGLHAVVRLPSGCDEAATVTAAAARGIALDGLTSFYAARSSPHPALVLGYANLAEPAIARGIAELARALR
jgi:GntR family transcriptional regulator/MocR family aminotransferase